MLCESDSLFDAPSPITQVRVERTECVNVDLSTPYMVHVHMQKYQTEDNNITVFQKIPLGITLKHSYLDPQHA